MECEECGNEMEEATDDGLCGTCSRDYLGDIDAHRYTPSEVSAYGE